jgi:dihydrofolate reductase
MINLIAAVGLHGEIGFEGRIPWLSDPNIANVTKADLAWFAKQTEDDVLVVGGRTYSEMLNMGFDARTRAVWCWHRTETPVEVIDTIDQRFPDKAIWICGGAKTYAAFMPYVQRAYISVIPWSGPADTFMPPILKNWGYTGGPAFPTGPRYFGEHGPTIDWSARHPPPPPKR